MRGQDYSGMGRDESGRKRPVVPRNKITMKARCTCKHAALNKKRNCRGNLYFTISGMKCHGPTEKRSSDAMLNLFLLNAEEIRQTVHIAQTRCVTILSWKGNDYLSARPCFLIPCA